MFKKFSIFIIVLSLCLLAGQSFAYTYNFDVLYSGASVASLNAGSDNPIGTDILPGDSFTWTITAKTGYFWQVLKDCSLFPLAAFWVTETGVRTGDFTLYLSKNGTNVLTLSETDAVNSWVHLGTNTISLVSGLEFDTIQLIYNLKTATEDPAKAADPTNLLSVDSTINSLLPIFGTPEVNPYWSKGAVTFTGVPIPGAVMLFGSGLAGLGLLRRRFTK